MSDLLLTLEVQMIRALLGASVGVLGAGLWDPAGVLTAGTSFGGNQFGRGASRLKPLRF
jgi:hypothetical protein